ncbi:hypothetical protein I3760_08G074700 [Carya illinoinensis]|nr:hypothetical protein I3760_08G074700 [Carya illinoinensis]
MEVEITSKECIKPSSPTPPNLKTQKLSLLDQLMPAVYYPMNQSTGCACSDDVESLDSLLPICWKVKDHLSIDCNDEGAYYSEACVDCSLVYCLDQPDLSSFVKFVPLESTSYRPTTGDHVAMIQVNRLACGAFSSAKKAFSKPFLRSSRRVTSRIVFDASAIASLKAKATSLSVQNPSRVEATSGMQRPAFIAHAVNLRRRAVPPFSESSMGNFVWTVGALCSVDDDEEIDVPSMVRKLREEITKINGDFVKNIQGDEGFPNLCEIMNLKHIEFSNAASTCEMDHVAFTSWCNFGLYDIDFGWGKPMWISHIAMTKRAEAWVWLDKKDMLMLVQDKELLAFASLDPSPITNCISQYPRR